MRVAPIALVLMFASSHHVAAQAPTPPKEFTVTAFILPSEVPTYDVGHNDILDPAPPVLWVGIKNETSRPFALCTTVTGFSDHTSGGGTGRSCHENWIVLPGETHFEGLNEISPDDGSSRILATVSVRGKPLASTGPAADWQLRWEGTIADAVALGDWIRTGP